MGKDTKDFNITFGISNSHAKYVRLIINSICTNHPENELNFHILTDNISNRNKRKLNEEVKRFKNATLKYYLIDKSLLKGLYSGKWHISTWYRILIPQLLDKKISRVLYLDSDTLINGNIRNLFDLDMTDKSIAAVHDSIPFNPDRAIKLKLPLNVKYVCAGVMLMNLDYWRDHNIKDKIVEFALENSQNIQYPDQDSINVVCKGSIKLLPFKYGYIDEFYGKKDSAIFHLAWVKPWKYLDNAPYYSIWEKYNNNLKDPINLILPRIIITFKLKTASIINPLLQFIKKK